MLKTTKRADKIIKFILFFNDFVKKSITFVRQKMKLAIL
jgi:hypothetical protein